ncbi:hypothetical protein O3S80_42385 [Streptomyces sp. Lzd4kr]|nr:hypothetical protein [Streptomyces sp. Lzd4kr]
MLAPPGGLERGGVWDQHLLLNKLRSKNQPDWSRAVIDSSHARAASTTSSPTARAPRSR